MHVGTYEALFYLGPHPEKMSPATVASSLHPWPGVRHSGHVQRHRAVLNCIKAYQISSNSISHNFQRMNKSAFSYTVQVSAPVSGAGSLAPFNIIYSNQNDLSKLNICMVAGAARRLDVLDGRWGGAPVAAVGDYCVCFFPCEGCCKLCTPVHLHPSYSFCSLCLFEFNIFWFDLIWSEITARAKLHWFNICSW